MLSTAKAQPLTPPPALTSSSGEAIARALAEELAKDQPDRSAAINRLIQAGARTDAATVASVLHAEVERLILIVPGRVTCIAAALGQLGRLAEQPAIEALGAMTGADALRELGRYPDALREYDRAGDLYLSAGDEIGWARTRIGAAATRRYVSELGPALEQAVRARSILRAAGLWLRLARLETAMGNLLLELGRLQEALEAQARAAEAAAHITDAEMRELAVAQIKVNEAAVHQRLDNYQPAVELLELAAITFGRYGRTAQIAVARGNLARCLAAQGHLSQALALALDVRRSCLSIGRVSHAAIFGQVAVDSLLELNRSSEAASLADEIVDQLDASGAGVDLAKSLLQRAMVRGRLEQFHEAAEDLARAEVLFRDAECAGWAAVARLHRAHVLVLSGAFDEGLREAVGCRDELEYRGLKIPAAQADLLRARVLGKFGRVEAARRLARAARSAGRHHEVPHLEYAANRVLGDLALTDRQALRAFAAAAQALEKSQSRILTEQRAAFLQLDDKLAVYEAAIRLALKAGNARRAFEFAERAKARALVDALALRARGVTVRPNTPPAQALANELERLRRRYDRLSSALLEPRPQDELGVSAVARVGDQLQRELEQCQSRISAVLDELRLTEAAGIQQLEALQGKLHSPVRYLGRGTALVQYQIMGDEITVFVLRSGRPVEARSTPAGAGRDVVRLLRLLELNIRTVNSGHRSPALAQQAKGLLQRLYARLVKPVEDLFDGCQKLVVVPHGVLHGIPFSALHDGERYMIERFELALAPSSTAIALYRRKRSGARAGKALVIAHSAEGNLPGALVEADIVANLLQATRLSESEATLDNLRDQVKDARLIHIAAHGHSRPDAPLFSHIRLADGQLMAIDCLDLQLDCDLVTLSACETGHAVVAAGDEPIGLTRSLLYAGARSVIQSLWRVDDHATLRLMTDIYQRLCAGASRSEALRAAQNAFLNDPIMLEHAHPAFWAAFELIGDWRPLQ